MAKSLSKAELKRKIIVEAEKFQKAMGEAEEYGGRVVQNIDKEKRQRQEQLKAEFERKKADVHEEYKTNMAYVIRDLERVNKGAGLWGAPWDDPGWEMYAPATELPPAIRIGNLTLKGSHTTLETPAFIPIIMGRNLVIKASGYAKARAVMAIRSVMLRTLAFVPPSKLRLLMIDPVGLGRNLADFNRLAVDHDMPDLVYGKIWAQSADIGKKLADLSSYMEGVFQTYLLGRYTTMEEYNAEAGEVAEPYTLVVVLDFPANFSNEAAKHLVSIATNGPRCGVYTILMVDTERELPREFNLADIERTAEVITMKTGQSSCAWKNEDYRKAILQLDGGPPPEQLERIINIVGQAAKEASKVVVPYQKIMPPAETWWQGSTARELKAPIGRAGARRIQYFELGRGTAQHALIAGRTGSGKSTLLHILITSLAMVYPPDELELYLIDFKKGVEFKDYATYKLPHARVIAVESEREFGLSVLQGLDEELERRGKAFRAAGCSNLAEYRELPETSSVRREFGKLPRILLIVDEFQEFFSAEDRISSQAALLFDRIMRQGRAFGIHALLSSQALTGAARLRGGVMDQMAVRIAFQCSEADSKMILSDDNPAAKLLKNPGEAFYNAESGLKEGNIRFQVAWLEDAEKVQYLKQIHQMSQERGYTYRQPIVFEGNAAPDISSLPRHPLQKILDADVWPGEGHVPRAYLGEPISIKESMSAHFPRRQGRNLLIVGKDEELAMGMFGTAIVSLAAQHKPGDIQVYLADLSLKGTKSSDFRDMLASNLPHDIRIVTSRELAGVINSIAETVQKRINGEEPAKPAVFLSILGLHRSRDLRRDDFSSYTYGRDDRPNTVEQFYSILKEGPEVGVHVIAWSNNCTSQSLVYEGKILFEFGMRVAMPMTDTESSRLIDTPQASRLKPYRALFYDDENVGVLHKFRPYNKLPLQWIQQVGRRLREKLV